MKLQKITNDRTGHITLEYDNGEMLSILWNAGSYTDNHYAIPPVITDFDTITKFLYQPWESTTVELYIINGEKIMSAFKKRRWESPTNATPLEDLLDLLIELRSM